MTDEPTLCRSCGEPLEQRFCATCGADSACTSCGSTLVGAFCGVCGAAASTPAIPSVAPATGGRPPWVIPVAIVVVIALLVTVGVIVVTRSDSREGNSESVAAPTVVESTTTLATTTTTVAPTTTAAPVTVPVCQTDPATLKAVLLTTKSFDATTLSHMFVPASSVRSANNGKYVQFRLDALDDMSGQPVGVIVRCESGSWRYVTVVDGYSCSPTFVGEDLAAARIFGVC